MRKVLNKKRNVNRKDVAHWNKIFIAHYLAFALYTLIFMTAKYYTGVGSFWPDVTGKNLWLAYVFLITPAVNASLHLAYQSMGSPWTRFSMWVFSFINMILIPVIIFVF